MNRLFDQLSDQLAQMLNNGKTEPYVRRFSQGGEVDGITNLGNTVGNAVGNIFGGSLGDEGVISGALSGLGKGLKESGNAAGYGSPLYSAFRLNEMGRFFKPTEPGNLYTNRYKTPPVNKPAQSTTASDFYARWYNTMRQFAEASEVSNRGMPQIRSTGNQR